MKKFLIFLLVVFVLGGVFFAGAVFGERTQRDLLLDYSDEEPEAESADDKVITVTNELLEEMLTDYFNDGGKYDYDEFWSDFSFAEVHPDGNGVAVSMGSGGAGSVMQSWFFTSDGGKSWELYEERACANGPRTVTYIGDTLITTSYGGAAVYSDNGKTLKKEVSFAELTGLSAYNGEDIPQVVSVNTEEGTVIFGFGAYDDAGQPTNKGYTYMAEFDKELNFITEIYKR